MVVVIIVVAACSSTVVVLILDAKEERAPLTREIVQVAIPKSGERVASQAGAAEETVMLFLCFPKYQNLNYCGFGIRMGFGIRR